MSLQDNNSTLVECFTNLISFADEYDSLLCIEHMKFKFHELWSDILAVAFKTYWYVFIFLLLNSTVGRKLKVRTIYINILDYVFALVAVKMEKQIRKDKKRRNSSSLDYGSSDDETNEDGMFHDENLLKDNNSETSLTDDKKSSQEDLTCTSSSDEAKSSKKLPDCPLDAPMLFASAGIRAITDDCVSRSLSPEQLRTWNLLSR